MLKCSSFFKEKRTSNVLHFIIPLFLIFTFQIIHQHSMTQTPTDQELLTRLKQEDRKAFRALFDRYYKYLVVTIFKISGDDNLAKDLAQDVFFELWKKRSVINIKSSLKSYLRRAVINKALNHFKAKRIDYQEPENLPDRPEKEASAVEELEAGDLKKIIHETIDALPERCRLVFTLCRLEGLNHKEVAAQLDISTKTVENQMTKALKLLKKAVHPYLSKELLILLLMFF